MIKLDEFYIIKLNIYFLDCIVKGENWWLYIIIIYNKYIVLANNRVYKI